MISFLERVYTTQAPPKSGARILYFMQGLCHGKHPWTKSQVRAPLREIPTSSLFLPTSPSVVLHISKYQHFVNLPSRPLSLHTDPPTTTAGCSHGAACTSSLRTSAPTFSPGMPIPCYRRLLHPLRGS